MSLLSYFWGWSYISLRPFINIIISWSLIGLINWSISLRIFISFIWLNIPIIIISVIIIIFWSINTSSLIRSWSFRSFVISSTRIGSCNLFWLIFICFSSVFYRSLSSVYSDIILRPWNDSIWRIYIWIIFYICSRYHISFRSAIWTFIRNVILISTRYSIIISISIIWNFIVSFLSGTNIIIFIIISWVNNSFSTSARRCILTFLFNIIEIFIRIIIWLICIIQIFSLIINIDIPIIYSLTSISILIIIYICFRSTSIYISITNIYSLSLWPIYILCILSAIWICN